MKSIFIYTILMFFTALLLFQCGAEPKENELRTAEQRKYTEITGSTMGTNYRILFYDSLGRDLTSAVDKQLVILDKEILSTYAENSVISHYNSSKTTSISFERSESIDHFLENYQISDVVHEMTNGAFDPTVMPLVNYWGFGYEKRELIAKDSMKVDSLRNLVSWDKLSVKLLADSIQFFRDNVNQEIDFSAVAKGYAAGVIGRLIKSQGVVDIYVEIGGEVFVSGVSPRNKAWKLGVNVPQLKSGITDIYEVLNVSDNCVASSGNYRNYYEIEGKIVSHTINPKTGYPEKNSLLSATVIGPDCGMVDALATAAMVMDWPRFLDIMNDNEDYDCYLIYSDETAGLRDTISEGARKYLLP